MNYPYANQGTHGYRANARYREIMYRGLKNGLQDMTLL